MVDAVVGRSLQGSWRDHDPRHPGHFFDFVMSLAQAADAAGRDD